MNRICFYWSRGGKLERAADLVTRCVTDLGTEASLAMHVKTIVDTASAAYGISESMRETSGSCLPAPTSQALTTFVAKLTKVTPGILLLCDWIDSHAEDPEPELLDCPDFFAQDGAGGASQSSSLVRVDALSNVDLQALLHSRLHANSGR